MYLDPIMPYLVSAILAVLVLGLLLRAIRQPYVVGYLIAGIILGPHGIGLVPMYDQRRGQGRINVSANPHVVREKAAVALIDADKSLGHPVSIWAMEMACEKARTTGVAIVGVRNSNHFGAAGYYARQAAGAGMIGVLRMALGLAQQLVGGQLGGHGLDVLRLLQGQ